MITRTNKHLSLAVDDQGREVIVGRNSSSIFNEAMRQREQANMGIPWSGANTGLPGGANLSNISTPGLLLPTLDGFVPSHPAVLNQLYREMYYEDPICGVATELLSTFPFGDFSLSGLNDERRLKKFAQCVESMKVRTLLPLIARDYLVLGKFIGTLNWDSQQKIFSGLAPQNIDFATIEPLPVHGADPIIRFKLPDNVIKMLNDPNKPEVRRIAERLPKEMLQSGNQGILLDPERLIFIARQGMTGDYQGTSMFRRVLAIWLQEKALIRGTLDSLWKRQRAVLHITIGDDTWIPVDQDFSTIANLFQGANHDPTGAVVVTPQSVNVNEIRRGDDFYKYSDIWDWSMRAKLAALGISENFISGDASIAATQGTISVTMQYFSAFRNEMTREVFYDKTFPTIAVENNFRKSSGNVVLGSYERERTGDGMYMGPRRDFNDDLYLEFSSSTPSKLYGKDLNDYAMPRVQWHDSLKPDTTQEFQDLLQRLSEKGVPIPLRMWAASAGVSLEHIAEQQDSDLKIRKHFDKWIKAIAKNVAAAAGTDGGAFGGGGGGDDGDTEESSALQFTSMLPDQGGTGLRSGILNREFDDRFEPREIDGTGRHRNVSAQRRRQIDDKMNRMIAEAAAECAQADAVKENLRYREANDSKPKVYHSRRPASESL